MLLIATTLLACAAIRLSDDPPVGAADLEHARRLQRALKRQAGKSLPSRLVSSARMDLTIALASAVRSPDVKHGLFISRKFKDKLEHWILPQLKVKLLLAEDDRDQQRKPSRLVERRALRSHK